MTGGSGLEFARERLRLEDTQEHDCLFLDLMKPKRGQMPPARLWRTAAIAWFGGQ